MAILNDQGFVFHCVFVFHGAFNDIFAYSMINFIIIPTILRPGSSRCSPVSMLPDLCSPVSMFPSLYVPRSLCSPIPMFSGPYVPQSLCSPVPMFPDTYVPRYLSSPECFFLGGGGGMWSVGTIC